MTKSKKTQLVRRALGLKDYQRLTSEALDGVMEELAKGTRRTEVIRVDGEDYRVADIFEGGNATWRPARVRRYHLVKQPKKAKGGRR